MHETGPFSIPAIRDFVPPKLRPWIIIAFVIVFQFSGGLYLAAVNEMVGSTALMQEDIMMAGYASMVGMGLTFAIMFRLKFRFTSKASLMTCSIALIISNLICMHTHSIPVLVITCFFAGIFRMWATFECNSTIQLWLTPKRDLSVFFCFIYLLVQSCIQLSGLVTIYTAFWAKWEYMHWLIIGLLLLVMLVTLWLFRSYRSLPKLPLFGIDWLGALMWGLVLLCILFVCVYGEHYDWYQSFQIRVATIIGTLILVLNLWRASFIRHPFIALKTWTYRSVWLPFILYIVIDILLAPSHLFEHVYMEGILGYDALNVISLNWVVLLGIVVGAGFTLLFIPLFLRSFGYVMIAICFLTVLSRVPFQHFFQAVSVQSFVSAGFGGALGTAILGHALNGAMKKNAMLLGAGLDHVNPFASRISAGELYGVVQQQALMISMKELYGWLILLALFCLLVFLVYESDIRPYKVLHPTYRSIRRFVKHELRMDKKLEATG